MCLNPRLKLPLARNSKYRNVLPFDDTKVSGLQGQHWPESPDNIIRKNILSLRILIWLQSWLRGVSARTSSPNPYDRMQRCLAVQLFESGWTVVRKWAKTRSIFSVMHPYEENFLPCLQTHFPQRISGPKRRDVLKDSPGKIQWAHLREQLVWIKGVFPVVPLMKPDTLATEPRQFTQRNPYKRWPVGPCHSCSRPNGTASLIYLFFNFGVPWSTRLICQWFHFSHYW